MRFCVYFTYNAPGGLNKWQKCGCDTSPDEVVTGIRFSAYRFLWSRWERYLI